MERRALIAALGSLSTIVLAPPAQALGESDAALGVRAALERGALAAVAALGQPGGFLDHPQLRIPLPGALEKAAKLLKATGQGRASVVLDGAMGTMIQRYKLGEADFRGERFADHPQGPEGQQRPAGAHPARRDPRDPRAVPGRRRRHDRDQHLRRHQRGAGRLRPGSTSRAR
jgi:hypothetical protein